MGSNVLQTCKDDAGSLRDAKSFPLLVGCGVLLSTPVHVYATVHSKRKTIARSQAQPRV